MSKWIKITDREVPCLADVILSDGISTTVGYRTGNFFYYHTRPGLQKPPTHWMILPRLPDES
jgi:hypothetical protein